ncbi:MAG: MurR/RpiR family transcriptional regulator [Eubacteriaceae bacterium]|nr:MurR/RpiR family transcriptional regulator [Eubacteriaceae bacterium]
MEDKKNDIIKEIASKYKTLSKSHKLVSDYIIENYEKAAFMTAASLGEKTGVSEATVVRLANILGYEGYPKLKKTLQDLIKTKLTTIQRIEMSSVYDSGSILKKVLDADMDNLRTTLEEADEEAFEKAADMIASAKKIYITGFRTSSLLSKYLGYYLDMILDNVVVVDYGAGDVYERLVKVNKGDLVIGISFPRYSAKSNEIISFVREKGTSIIAITDNELSPIVKYSDCCLIAKSNIMAFVDTVVAPLSLLNALIIAVGYRNKSKTRETFNELEKIWAEHDIYAMEMENPQLKMNNEMENI